MRITVLLQPLDMRISTTQKCFLFICFINTALSSGILFGQDQKSTRLELESAIGYVNLLVKDGKGGARIFRDFSEEIWKDEGFLGYSFQLGLLGNRQIGRSFWLKSGAQLQYMSGQYDLSSTSYFVNLPSDLNEERKVRVESSFYNFQIPLLLEYQKSLKKADLYSQLGLGFSFSYISQKYKNSGTSYYAYSAEYVESCNCYVEGERLPFNTPEVYFFEDKQVFPQHELKGIFAIGGIFKTKRKKTWRIGYRISADLFNSKKGNNGREELYEYLSVDNSKYRHIIHYLDFSFEMGNKEKEIDGSDSESVAWNGWSLGYGLSLLNNPVKRERAGRSGLGLGRGVHLLYVSKMGLGGRLEAARWVAPKSNYATWSVLGKAEILFELPDGIQFHAGVSRRIDNDVDGGGGKDIGGLAGISWIVPFHPLVGMHVRFTGHYYDKLEDQNVLMELGIGVVYRFWR